MPLTNREAFKVGFLSRCADAGMTPAETLFAVKEATDKLAGLLGDVSNTAGGLGNAILSTALPMAVLTPPILGGLAGAGLAKTTDIDDTDVNEIKDREVIDAYKTEAERLRRQRAVRDYAKARATTGRRFS